jgi:hypothetical protein
MKDNKLFVLALACVAAFSIQLKAQENTDAKTLFGASSELSMRDLGFWVAPSYGFTQMDGGAASLFYLRGGVAIKDKLSFGAFYQVSINEIFPRSESISNVYMDYWAVGGFAEYTLLSKRLFHLTFPLYFGYGEVQMDNDFGDAGLGEANFFQIEPSALLELNLNRYVRLNAGAGYRFVGEMQYRNFNQADISGLTGYIGLKIGLFR